MAPSQRCQLPGDPPGVSVGKRCVRIARYRIHDTQPTRNGIASEHRGEPAMSRAQARTRRRELIKKRLSFLSWGLANRRQHLVKIIRMTQGRIGQGEPFEQRRGPVRNRARAQASH